MAPGIFCSEDGIALVENGITTPGDDVSCVSWMAAS
jgi:hypothetical protein